MTDLVHNSKINDWTYSANWTSNPTSTRQCYQITAEIILILLIIETMYFYSTNLLKTYLAT